MLVEVGVTVTVGVRLGTVVTITELDPVARL
jgi:hypothetical protein